MNVKALIVAFIGVSALSYGLYLSSQSSITAKPINIHPCEDKEYILKFKSLDVDKDLVPGSTVTMTATFTPTQDGSSELMSMLVYFRTVKLWTQNVVHHDSYTNGTDFVYVYTITLPGFIPHINVSMKLDFFDGAKTELGCIAFDLNL